jgi:hypothetical protein
MKPRPATSTPRPGCGYVSAHEILTIREFGRRLNLASRALADAQRQGLHAITFGRVKFVLGSDALAWFRSLAEQQVGRGDHE